MGRGIAVDRSEFRRELTHSVGELLQMRRQPSYLLRIPDSETKHVAFDVVMKDLGHIHEIGA